MASIPRRLPGRPEGRTIAIGSALAAFVVCSVLPVAYMAGFALAGEPGDGTMGAGSWLLEPRQLDLLINSATLAAGTALGATLVGVPLGVALARIAFPLKAVLRVTLVAPVLLPPYVAGLAWVYLGGTGGLAARVVGRDVLSAWTYSLPGAIAVLSLVFFPLSMLATEVSLRRVESRLEEAALLVASPGRAFSRITLRLAAPGIGAAGSIVFVLALAEFGVPGLLQVRVYTTEVFTAFAALYDFARATYLAVPLLLLSMILATGATVLAGDRFVVTRRGAVGRAAITFDSWRWPATCVVLVVLGIALVLPIAILAREARGASSFADLVAASRAAIVNSLVLAGVGASAIVGVAVWLGYARARARAGVGRLADVLFVVLFAVPSTVVGVGLIGLWNRSGPLGAVYGTHAMLLVAYLARFLPVAALMLAASVRQVPASHEEAAAVSGAGWALTMRRVLLPQIAPGLAAAWIVTFILSFGELGASLLVSPPGEGTLPIRIYTIIANTPAAEVAALALLQVAVVFAPLGVLGLGLALKDTA